jgi:DNA repair exonuclease SbcCD ATPase subunit
MDPTTAREALIVEAVGDAARLIRQVEALVPVLDDTCRALLQANEHVRHTLSGFEGRIGAATENAKARTAHYLAAQVNEAARRSIDQQSRAMADAARVAFGAELGATVQRLNTALRPLIERQQRWWQTYLTHLAAAAVASAVTLAITVLPWAR